MRNFKTIFLLSVMVVAGFASTAMAQDAMTLDQKVN